MPASHFSQDQLSYILLKLPVGITVQDTRGEFFYANERGVKLLGFKSLEEMKSMKNVSPLDLFNIYTADDKPYGINDLPSRRVMRGEKLVEDIVKYELKKLKQIRWANVRAMGLYDKSGKLEYVVNMIEDITEIKETERRLQDANERVTKILQGVLVHDELSA